MSDLDAAARQALQDVLALKEEMASAADELSQLQEELEEGAERLQEAAEQAQEALESGARRTDEDQDRLESQAGETDDAVDDAEARCRAVWDQVEDELDRMREAATGFDGWCRAQDEALGHELETLEDALEALEQATDAAERRTSETAERMCAQCDALRTERIEPFEREGMERARQLAALLTGTVQPRIEEAWGQVVAQMEESRERLGATMSSATESFSATVEDAAGTWHEAHLDALEEMESQAAEVERLIADLVVQAREQGDAVDEARQGLADARSAMRERLGDAHDVVHNLLDRLRPLRFLPF